MGVTVCACVTVAFGVCCQPLCLGGTALAEYTPSEASEPKIADCLGGAVFACARNSPIVFPSVLFMGVTVCKCLIMPVCTVMAVWPSTRYDG